MYQLNQIRFFYFESHGTRFLIIFLWGWSRTWNLKEIFLNSTAYNYTIILKVCKVYPCYVGDRGGGSSESLNNDISKFKSSDIKWANRYWLEHIHIFLPCNYFNFQIELIKGRFIKIKGHKCTREDLNGTYICFLLLGLTVHVLFSY